nr:hypothetical protein [Tanacetum cinerariifolium]
MIELVMHTVKNDMVIHIEKTRMMILEVEIEYVGMIADVVDTVTWSFNGLQPEQVDLKCVHALNEPHLHDIRVVPNRHEVDQHLSYSYHSRAVKISSRSHVVIPPSRSGTESEVQDDSSRSRNETDVDDADIRAIYDEEPMAEVQLTAKCNIFAIGQHHTEQPIIINEVLGKLVLQSLREQSVVRQPNAFKSERPQMSRPWFASQVDVNNNLSRLVTQHYLHKRRESVFAKPDHMIAYSESRNSSKNTPRFSSNDMVYNHYLDEARKKTQERDRNSKTSVMPSARFQSTADDSNPKPRSTNHSTSSFPISKISCIMIVDVPIANHSKSPRSFLDSKYFVYSTCHKCVFNANHDACITTFLKEVKSHATI